MTTTGLRDRKRQQTRSAIEEAAVFLVLRDGLDETTVDAISERADVSPRTFFNYFDSKDAAILGLHQREVGEELVAESLEEAQVATSEDLVRAVVRLLLSVMGARNDAQAAVQERRMEIVRQHPKVLAGQFDQLAARAGRLAEAVVDLTARSPLFADEAPLPEAERTARAQTLLGLCGSALRVAVREWSDQQPDPTSSHTPHTPHTTDVRSTETDVIDHIERRAVDLATTIARKLS